MCLTERNDSDDDAEGVSVEVSMVEEEDGKGVEVISRHSAARGGISFWF